MSVVLDIQNNWHTYYIGSACIYYPLRLNSSFSHICCIGIDIDTGFDPCRLGCHHVLCKFIVESVNSAAAFNESKLYTTCLNRIPVDITLPCGYIDTPAYDAFHAFGLCFIGTLRRDTAYSDHYRKDCAHHSPESF